MNCHSKNTYKTIATSLCFYLALHFAIAQDLNEKHVVESFFYDVYSNEKTLNQISEEYRYKESNQEGANEKFVSNIKYLQTDKKHLYSKFGEIKIESYNESNIEDLWRFEIEKDEKIIVVSVDNRIETYVLLKDSKIVSFVYFRKGSDNPAVFIPYWST